MAEESYIADTHRYETMNYRRCGRSGLLLPALSLGLWHNFGSVDDYATYSRIALTAFDNGITHFDLANNYGPVYGSAETNFGRILKQSLGAYRDELIISTKAGYDMWPGPYGNWGSRKYLMASLDQSLKRMGLEYVDIFYSHRYDENTPLDETMQALVDIVRQGKALYVGLSNYPVDKLLYATKYLQDNNVHCLIYQGKYNMMFRDVEQNMLKTLMSSGIGFTAFCPVAQGILTNKYLNGIPADSRIGKGHYLTEKDIRPEVLDKVARLNNMALQRGQTLAQMAVAWILANEATTSVIIGPRTMEQLKDNLGALKNTCFSDEERRMIDEILK